MILNDLTTVTRLRRIMEMVFVDGGGVTGGGQTNTVALQNVTCRIDKKIILKHLTLGFHEEETTAVVGVGGRIL
jgi:ABC-type multidrug transport system fused ATPase/permease subunit